MTDIHVDDKTGRESEMTARISEILTEAAPLVEKITGLCLPAAIFCEVHDPDGMAREAAVYLRGALQRDTAGLALSSYKRRQIAMMPEMQRRVAALVGAGKPADVVTNSIFQPRLLVAPDVLRSERPDARLRVYEHVVDILVMAGQISASRGAVVPPKVWPLSRSFGFDPAIQVMDGHSNWASHEVTSLLVDRPTSGSTGRVWPRRAVTALAAPLRRMSDESRSQRAAEFVRRAIEVGGVEAFNRVWTGPGLLPTRDELSTPAQWIQRISR
jgi:Zincin-like metallopeptidase